MSRLETKSVSFEIKAVDESGSSLEGIAAAFSNIDGGRDIVAPGAYDDYIAFFKSEGKIRDEHAVTTGKIVDAASTPTGLYIKGQISATSAGMDQRILLKDKVITRLSIGHYVLARDYLETPEEIKAFWQSVGYQPSDQDLIRAGMGSVRLITRAKPVEASTTYNPMNDKCAITSVKSNGQPAGLTFADHSENTLAVLEEFHDRARRLMEKRSESGRTLSRKHLAAFEALRQRLADLIQANTPAETKAETTTPDVPATPEIVTEGATPDATPAEATASVEPEPEPKSEATIEADPAPTVEAKSGDSGATTPEAEPAPEAADEPTAVSTIDATDLFAQFMAIQASSHGISL